jgi:diacylglycerol kinase (ATP)
MRVALVHNRSAGEGHFTRGELAALLRDASHEVSEFGKKRKEIERAIAERPDILAVAGGDGTVAKAAIALNGSGIPMYVIPAGTSNNIARSLDLTFQPDGAAGLHVASRLSLDVGYVEAPWGRKRFVEATGAGFIGMMLRRGVTVRGRFTRFIKSFGRSRQSRITRTLAGVVRFLRAYPARYHEIVADGEDLSGNYLMVEAMSIRAIGPRLTLAPHAEPGDGWLDLVMVRPEDREELARYILSRCTEPRFPPIIARRVRTAEFSWPSRGGHVDDAPWPGSGRKVSDARGAARVRVGIEGTVTVLRPNARQLRPVA